jgi:hypothetical protein
MNTISSSLQKAKPTKISKYFEVTPNEGSICQMFNTLNVQLTTRFDPDQHCTSYDLFLQNYDKLNLSAQTAAQTAATTATVTEEEGDLLVLLEALKYLIYHPFLSRKLNKYDVTIYTNSKHIANFSVIDEDTKATTQIRSLLGCIRHVSIILQ